MKNYENPTTFSNRQVLKWLKEGSNHYQNYLKQSVFLVSLSEVNFPIDFYDNFNHLVIDLNSK